MRNNFHTAASALAASVMFTSLALGADDQTTVRVALLDMTAMMAPGVMGQGMMGPCMMGYGMMGPGATGQGMMGRGMMGRNMTGQAMMGYGMMGPGMQMRGMMSIRVIPSSAKSGKVTFEVTNLSQSIVHELMIVKVDNPDAALPYDFSTFRVAEDQVTVAGDTGEMPVNSSKTLEVSLAAGSYLLLCNVPGHYAAGMVVPFTVNP